MTNVQERLFAMQDREFCEFQAKLCPSVAEGTMIGVRTPLLRSMAKELIKSGEADAFLAELPHRYFEENQLHAFIISELKSYDRVIEELERFLPQVDNWATCDQMSPKVFKKHPAQLPAQIEAWLRSEHPYTIRFGIGTLMQHYLDGEFKPEYPERLAQMRSEEYYVNMMLAWYFATALAKQYDAVLPYLTDRRLDGWVHNKTIQKARESYRITPEQKEYLKSLKIPKS